MAETKMQLADWLDDLCVRFILNLPQEELESVERICFQVEEAQWFYEDFVRPLDPSLPSMNLRQFCLLIFQVCPFLSGYRIDQHLSAYSQFLAYKTRVPVRGVIMLNESMDDVVLVKGYKRGANWSFPRGKINKDETDLDCAIREAYEETGFNLSDAGLVPDESKIKYIEVTMREQHMKLFVFRNVPQTTHFQPRTRKEISKISWWKLATLPGYQKKKKNANDHEDALSANKLYMVAPFLPPLRKWIAQQRKADARLQAEGTGNAYLSAADGQLTDGDALGEEDILSDVPHQLQHQAASMGTGTQDGWAQSITTNPAQAANVQIELDAAARMKQLLGVSQPATQPQQQQTSGAGLQRPQEVPGVTPDSRSGNLLALLQGSKPEQSAISKPPKTPFEQIGPQVDEPRSPTHHHHHHQVRAPSEAVQQPPPQFPISPEAISGTSHQPKSSYGGYGPRGMYSIEQVFGMSQSPFTAKPAAPTQATAPYQRTGDPSFARIGQSQAQQGLTAPAASQLPAPKLSNHAMNLLNVFKGSEKKPAAASPRPNAAPAEVHVPLAPIGTPPGGAPSRATKPKPEPPSRSNSLQAFGGLIPTNVAPMSRRECGATSNVAEKPKAASQQDKLLNLFKSGSPAPNAPAKSVPKQPPAELSAIRSPAPSSEALLGQTTPADKAVPTMNEAPMTIPKILQRPASSHKQANVQSPAANKSSGVDSETNSGKKKHHTGKHGPRQPKAKSPAITPKQILKRPQEVDAKDAGLTEATQRDVSPSAPASQARPPELDSQQSNQPFQPQILRRPQSSSRPSTAVEQPLVNQAQAATDERKQSLLDIFNAPKKPAGGVPQITAQATYLGPVPGMDSSKPQSQVQQAFLGGLGIAQAEANDTRKSQAGSPVGGAASSGAMSPSTMSSADRGFLLNYLEGVVKGTQR